MHHKLAVHECVWTGPKSTIDGVARNQVFGIFELLDGALSAEFSRAMRFDPGGQGVFDEWRTNLENRLRAGDLFRDPVKAGYLAKCRSLMPSLAGIFRLIDLASSPTGQTELGGNGVLFIDADCARRAVEWCRYLETHVDRLHRTAPAVSPAQALARKIEIGAVTHGMSVSELRRAGWAGLATPEVVDTALAELTKLSWLRVHEVQSGPQGGRPSTVLEFHPAIRNREPGEVFGVYAVQSGESKTQTPDEQINTDQQQATWEHSKSTEHSEIPSMAVCDLTSADRTAETTKTSSVPDLPTVERRDGEVIV